MATARSARGQGGGAPARGPPLSAAGLPSRRRVRHAAAAGRRTTQPSSSRMRSLTSTWWRLIATSGTQRTCNPDEAQLVFDLLAARSIQCRMPWTPDHLGLWLCGSMSAAWLARAAGPGAGSWPRTRSPCPAGCPVLGGSHHQAGGPVRPPPARRRVGSPPGLGVPVAARPWYAPPASRRDPPARPRPARGPRPPRGVSIRAIGPGPAAGLSAMTSCSPASQ